MYFSIAVEVLTERSRQQAAMEGTGEQSYAHRSSQDLDLISFQEKKFNENM